MNTIITGAGLGQGEIEAIVLYKTMNADYLLIDDNRARKVARLNHIIVTGSLGILMLAKQKGLILQVKPYLDRLQQTNIRISTQLIRRTLTLVNE